MLCSIKECAKVATRRLTLVEQNYDAPVMCLCDEHAEMLKMIEEITEDVAI